MKVTGAPPPTVSTQTTAPGPEAGGVAGLSRPTSIRLDTARHGVDGPQLLAEMRSSPALAEKRDARRDGANQLRNAMIRDFGADVAGPLFEPAFKTGRKDPGRE